MVEPPGVVSGAVNQQRLDGIMDKQDAINEAISCFLSCLLAFMMGAMVALGWVA